MHDGGCLESTSHFLIKQSVSAKSSYTRSLLTSVYLWHLTLSKNASVRHFIVHFIAFSTLNCFIYRSVPLIRPPNLYTTSRLKWGGGLYSRMQLVSTISPPPYEINAFHYQLTMATTFRIESTVRGHHVYKAAWSPYIGEELPVQREVNNIHDDFAVAVLKNGNTVGHVPREISRVCWYFLHKSGSETTIVLLNALATYSKHV